MLVWLTWWLSQRFKTSFILFTYNTLSSAGKPNCFRSNYFPYSYFGDRLQLITVVSIWGMWQTTLFSHTLRFPLLCYLYAVTASCIFLINSFITKKYYFDVFDLRFDHFYSYIMIKSCFFFTYIRILLGSTPRLLKIKSIRFLLFWKAINKQHDLSYLMHDILLAY